MNDAEEKVIIEQQRRRSATWWIGMIDAAVVGICGVLMASGTIPENVGAAIMAASAGVYVYCNGNNPSIKGQY